MDLVNFTCEWSNSQLDPPLVTSLRRLVVNHLMASYVIRQDRKSVASQSLLKFLSHTNFCWVKQVTWGGRIHVVGRSLIGRKASQVSQSDSGTRVYAHRLTNGLRGSRARKSVMVRSQVTLITWPITHFLFTGMSVAPQHRCQC